MEINIAQCAKWTKLKRVFRSATMKTLAKILYFCSIHTSFSWLKAKQQSNISTFWQFRASFTSKWIFHSKHSFSFDRQRIFVIYFPILFSALLMVSYLATKPKNPPYSVTKKDITVLIWKTHFLCKEGMKEINSFAPSVYSKFLKYSDF